MVEFALLAPLTVVLLLAFVDFGRGLLAYTEIAAGARAGARQAVLQYNAGSNTSVPSCNPACKVPGVLPIIRSFAAHGFAVVYADSVSSSQPPSYGICTLLTPCTATVMPALSGSAQTNTIYAFIYEMDTGGPRWATSSPPARTSGYHTVVVDLRIRWTPITTSLLGLPSAIEMDSQTVQRIEF